MILRLQNLEELQKLEARIKEKSKNFRIHMTELRSNTGTSFNAAPQSSETPRAYVSGDAQVQSTSRTAVAAPLKTPSKTPQKGPRASKELGSRAWQVQSPLEAEFLLQVKSAKLELPFEQFRVFVDRKFRLDFAWPAQKVAVLIQGNVHRIQDKFYRDCELFCLLTMAGWKFLTLSRREVKSTEGLKWLKELLGMTPLK